MKLLSLARPIVISAARCMIHHHPGEPCRFKMSRTFRRRSMVTDFGAAGEQITSDATGV
jgi:hypothetical protein